MSYSSRTRGRTQYKRSSGKGTYSTRSSREMYLSERLRWAEGVLKGVLKIAVSGVKNKEYAELALRNIITQIETYMEQHSKTFRKEKEEKEEGEEDGS